MATCRNPLCHAPHRNGRTSKNEIEHPDPVSALACVIDDWLVFLTAKDSFDNDVLHCVDATKYVERNLIGGPEVSVRPRRFRIRGVEYPRDFIGVEELGRPAGKALSRS
jgi:hypothetical protein